jgi:hypothetical protein
VSRCRTYIRFFTFSLDNADVLTWMPGGKAFTIINHRKFVTEKMPELFGLRNMSSFVRKLCRWGFTRQHDKKTRNSDIFKHNSFVAHKPELLYQVKCVGRIVERDTILTPREVVASWSKTSSVASPTIASVATKTRPPAFSDIATPLTVDTSGFYLARPMLDLLEQPGVMLETVLFRDRLQQQQQQQQEHYVTMAWAETIRQQQQEVLLNSRLTLSQRQQLLGTFYDAVTLSNAGVHLFR